MPDNEPVDPLGIEFLKDRYDFELERKEKLTDALTLPIGVLTVLGSIVGAMAQSFSYKFPIRRRSSCLCSSWTSSCSQSASCTWPGRITAKRTSTCRR